MSGEGKKRDIIIWCWLEVGWSLHNDDSSEAATQEVGDAERTCEVVYNTRLCPFNTHMTV